MGMADRPSDQDRLDQGLTFGVHPAHIHDLECCDDCRSMWLAGHKSALAIQMESEGAAPRAEGLQPDTPASQFADRLAEALDKEWDAFLIEGEPSLNFGDYAERVAARLSRRPSDERVPETEEPR